MPYSPDPTFATNRIIARLQGDTILVGMTGTVLNRPPAREGRGKTPTAFDADLRLQPTVYVMEATRGGGPNVRRTPSAVTDRVRVYFIGPSDEERKDVLRQAKVRVRRLLTKMWPDTTPDQPGYGDPWYYRNEDDRIMFARTEVVDSGFYTSEIFVGESASEGFLDCSFDGQVA